MSDDQTGARTGSTVPYALRPPPRSTPAFGWRWIGTALTIGTLSSYPRLAAGLARCELRVCIEVKPHERINSCETHEANRLLYLKADSVSLWLRKIRSPLKPPESRTCAEIRYFAECPSLRCAGHSCRCLPPFTLGLFFCGCHNSVMARSKPIVNRGGAMNKRSPSRLRLLSI